jgi:phosphatidylethanolamine/phosphatidyl-N-methylethanolamine N-methyltransferase
MLHRDHRLFLSRFIRHPLKVGAVLPSSQALAEAMADQVDVKRKGQVLELGAGTGIVTQALLEAGLPPEKLTILERDGKLHRLLERRFPGVHTLQGDAAELKSILDFHHVPKVHTVVSSLPLVSFNSALRQAILQQVFAVLPEDGTLIQYTYSLSSPVPKRERRILGIEGDALERVWKNVPPARIWKFQAAA